MNRHPSPTDTRVATAARAALVENLEARTLLSAVAPPPSVVSTNTAQLLNGTLLIQGSPKGDLIEISDRPAQEGEGLAVKINRKLIGIFNWDDVRVIRAYGLGGSDRMIVSEANGEITTPTYLLGGNGNDTMTGSHASDTIVGGKGDDLIQGMAGNDWVDGSLGNDRILAGDGKDTITGGPGNDLINSGADKDKVIDLARGDVLDTGAARLLREAKKKTRFGGGVIYKRRKDPALRQHAFMSTVVGLTPQQIRQAYEFGDLSDKSFKNRGQGQTIAIVVAHHYPTALNDVNVFSRQFGLKEMDATSFQYVFATGVRPTVDAAWAGEATLDLEWAHAIAPAAKIILVEADTSLTNDLYRGIGKAIDVLQPTGGVVMMSFGSDESFFDTTLATTFKNKKTGNISFVSSTGDAGGSLSAPAVDPEVLAVGGTFLTVDADGNRIDESAWIDGGGGTSQVFDLPEYQKNLIVEGNDIGDLGDHRVVPDVAYVADPASGVAVYSTTPDENGNTGWNAVGGTSVGVPQWAGLATLANQKRLANDLPILGNGQLNNYIYGIARKFDAQTFNDIVTGDNTFHPATAGFDQATGWGTPRATNLIDKLAVANSDNLVSTRARVPFKWQAKFAKDLLQGLNNNAVTTFNGRGTARVRPNDADFVMDQGGPQFDPLSGQLLPPPLDQIDFFATGFERDGNTIVGRGAANVVTQDGYVATFALKFQGRLYRINGQDKITGSFFAISHRGIKLKVGGNPILEGVFVASGSAF